jgi:Asp-tRNA(Asn)/Glu-tRNA(Gln) amidotransferase A subunit family amidase
VDVEIGDGLGRDVLPCEFDVVSADHQLINDIEGARSLRVEAGRGKISPETLAMMTRAESTTWSRELAARRRLASLGVALEEIFQSFDVIVAPSCGMVAPLGVGSTGPSDFIKFWTACGLPQANVPLPRATGELPLGLQLIGRFVTTRGS